MAGKMPRTGSREEGLWGTDAGLRHFFLQAFYVALHTAKALCKAAELWKTSVTFLTLLGLIEHSIGKPALNADRPGFSWYLNLWNSPKPLRSAMLQKGRI